MVIKHTIAVEELDQELRAYEEKFQLSSAHLAKMPACELDVDFTKWSDRYTLWLAATGRERVAIG